MDWGWKALGEALLEKEEANLTKIQVTIKAHRLRAEARCPHTLTCYTMQMVYRGESDLQVLC